MHLVEFFHATGDPRSREARTIFEEVVEEREDLVFICYDVETPVGQEKASMMEVYDVPTAVIDRQRAMMGVPSSKEQVMRTLR